MTEINLLPWKKWNAPVGIAPLVHFRILFGLLMLISLIRFVAKGWITEQYLKPTFHFKYFGFHWVQCPDEPILYGLFGLLMLSCVCIMLGLFYRTAIISFFLGFSYVELIDATNYLNHYYFISLIAFLLILVPANKCCSLDVQIGLCKQQVHAQRWQVGILRAQMIVLYFFAGLAKLNPDWLLNAQPLAIWLSAKTNTPLIGNLLDETWVHYFFSWFGACYDLVIPFLLLNRRTVKLAFLLVVSFHLLTGLLFQIGMFPYVMIACASIFFSQDWHTNVLSKWSRLSLSQLGRLPIKTKSNKLFYAIIISYFFIQLILPLRFLAYPGSLFWTEQGYRLSWRVMLMEKAGYITFTVKDGISGESIVVDNQDFLTAYQEKMMATQPDFILQFAHFLAKEYLKQGLNKPEVYAESYVAINGRPSKRFIDNSVNLAAQTDTWKPKTWILPSE